MATIEINGVKYEERPKKKLPSGNSFVMASLMMMMAGRTDSTNAKPEVNLVEEFELIQNKKSKLSRSHREWVVNQFNKKYQIIAPPDLKGTYNGNCNRTVCQKPGAVWYNHSTRLYYCPICADLINRANKIEAMELFGHDICTLGKYESNSEKD